jgi:hypothetical protein
MDLYLNGFHFYADDMGRLVQSHHYCTHLTEDLHQCTIFDGNTQQSRLIRCPEQAVAWGVSGSSLQFKGACITKFIHCRSPQANASRSMGKAGNTERTACARATNALWRKAGPLIVFCHRWLNGLGAGDWECLCFRL